MRRFALAFLLAVSVIPASADTQVVDGITWTYTIANGTASVGGGEPAVPTSTTGTISIPSTLGRCPVTSIGEGAFADCSGLTSVTIPSSVTSIEEEAFFGCSGLTAISIPDSVTNIEEWAFQGCPITSVRVSARTAVVGTEFWDEEFGSAVETATAEIDGWRWTYRWPNGSDWCEITGWERTADDERPLAGSTPVPFHIPEIVGGKTLASVCGEGNCHDFFPSLMTIPPTVLFIGGSFGFADENYNRYGPGNYDYDYSRANYPVRLPEGLERIDGQPFPHELTVYVWEDCPAAEDDHSNMELWTTSYRKTTDGSNEWAYVVSVDPETDEVSASVRFCPSRASDRLLIPDELDGLRVKLVGWGALLSEEGLKELVVPEGVTWIDWYAFAGCPDLENVSLPDGMGMLQVGAFSSCSNLVSVSSGTFDRGSRQYAEIRASAFKDCVSLRRFDIPEGVDKMGSCVFLGCANMETLGVPASLATLADGRQPVSFPSAVGGGCTSLQTVEIDAGNEAFRSIDGSVCDKPGKTLLYVPSGLSGTFDALDGVTSIGGRAFSRCSGLTSIAIPGGVTDIGELAFYGCSGLMSIAIPGSVTNVGDLAFSLCTGLKRIVVPDAIADQTGAWRIPETCSVVLRSELAGKKTADGVPYEWFYNHGALLDASGDDCEAASNLVAANGRPAWECYVADLSPEDPDDDLVATIEIVDGKPEVLIERGESAARVYTTQGAKTSGGGWDDLEDGEDWDAAGYRFFRVKVSLPE